MERGKVVFGTVIIAAVAFAFLLGVSSNTGSKAPSVTGGVIIMSGNLVDGTGLYKCCDVLSSGEDAGCYVLEVSKCGSCEGVCS